MDNYFILSSKDEDKWDKVVLNMTSVKLETCIHKILKDDSLIISTCTRIVCTRYTCNSCTYTLVCMSFLDLLTNNVSYLL